MLDNRNPIGIYEKALNKDLDWLNRLSTAKKIGFDFLEISIDETDKRLNRLYWNKNEVRTLNRAVDESGLPILSMCLSVHRRFPLGSEDAAIRAKGLDIMKRAIDFSLNCGIRYIQLAGYDVYYEEGNDRTRNYFIENIKKSIDIASRCGVILAVETMDHPFLNSITKAMNLVKKFNSPWFQIYPDIGNLTAWEKDVDAELELGIEHCVAVHLKETKIGVYKQVPFTQGIVNFIHVISKLISLGYQGPFLIEMWTEEDESQSKAEFALNYIRNIVNNTVGSFA